MKKRILSFLLSALILLAVLPVGIFAGGDSEPLTGRDLTDAIADLYVDGAFVILLGYNASTDGTVTITNGKGTWTNLGTGGTTYNGTLNSDNTSFTGKDDNNYSTAWQIREDGSVGYDMPVSYSNYWNMYMNFAKGAVGTGDYTVELVCTLPGYQLKSDTDYTGQTLKNSKRQIFYNTHLIGLGEATQVSYTDGMTSLPISDVFGAYSEDGSNNKVSSSGGFSGKSFSAFSAKQPLNHTFTYTAAKQTYDVDGENICTRTVESTSLDGGARFFYGQPADIYALRIYTKVLTADEKAQNHFADLVGMTGANIDFTAFAALSNDQKKAIYHAASKLELSTATKADVEILVATEGAIATVLTADGISVNVDESFSNALRSMYTIDRAQVTALVAAGYSVEIGAMIARAGEGADYFTYTDMTLDNEKLNVDQSGLVSLAVYSENGVIDDAKLLSETETKAEFAYSVNYDDLETAGTAEAYNMKFVFRGYVKLTKGAESWVYYVDPTASWLAGVAISDAALISQLPATKADKITAAISVS